MMMMMIMMMMMMMMMIYNNDDDEALSSARPLIHQIARYAAISPHGVDGANAAASNANHVKVIPSVLAATPTFSTWMSTYTQPSSALQAV